MGSNSLATSVTEPYPTGQRTRNEQKAKIGGYKEKSSVAARNSLHGSREDIPGSKQSLRRCVTWASLWNFNSVKYDFSCYEQEAHKI